jgi:hypothetical protein
MKVGGVDFDDKLSSVRRANHAHGGLRGRRPGWMGEYEEGGGERQGTRLALLRRIC